MSVNPVVRLAAASVRKCGSCGGGLSALGLIMLAAFTSACTAGAMARLQSSQRSAVAICGAAEAIRAAGGDRATVQQADAWCRASIRLATAETTSAASQLEHAIDEADTAGIEVPAQLRAAADAGELDNHGNAARADPAGEKQ
jgi:hypothetical protein